MDSKLKGKIQSLNRLLGSLIAFRNIIQIEETASTGLWVTAYPVIDNLSKDALKKELEIKIKDLMKELKDKNNIDNISRKAAKLRNELYRIAKEEGISL